MRKILYLAIFVVFISALYINSSNGVSTSGNLGNTFKDCSSCHSGGAGTTILDSINFYDSMTNQLVVNGGYIPGKSYFVVFKGHNTGSLPKFGLQLQQLAGTFHNPIGSTGISPNGLIFSHNTAIAGIAGSYIASVYWTAPSVGTGNITFNGILCAVDGNGLASNDLASSIVNLTLREIPIPSVSLSVRDTNICVGQSVTMLPTITNAGNYPTIYWYKNGILVDSVSTNYTTTSLGNGDTVWCVVKSALFGNATKTSNKVVFATSPATIVISANKTSICQYDNVSFSSVITHGGFYPAYQWYKNDTAIAGATASTFSTTSLAATDTISCRLTSSLSCNPASVKSNRMAVLVIPSPIHLINYINASNSAPCAGDIVTFKTNIRNGGTDSTLRLWYKNGNLVGQGDSAKVQILSSSDVILLTNQSNLQCATPKVAQLNYNIPTVNSLPTVSYKPALPYFCSGDTVIVHAVAVGNAPFTYKWNNKTKTADTLIEFMADTLAVVVTDKNGCKVYGDTILVSQYDTPAMPTVIQGANTNLLQATTKAYTYLWYQNGVLQPMDTTRTIEITSSGNYSVQTLTEKGCMSTVSDYLVATYQENLAIKPNARQNIYSIYPNPAHNHLYFKALQTGSYDLKLYDNNGRLLRSEMLGGGKTHPISIDTKGNYYLMIEHNDLIFSEKITIE